MALPLALHDGIAGHGEVDIMDALDADDESPSVVSGEALFTAGTSNIENIIVDVLYS